MTSPGTTSLIGTSCALPSRKTELRTCTNCLSFSAARPARYSCTKSSVTLSITINAMIAKLSTSPITADIRLATRRISTSGFPKRRRN
jgi:hypothetical protein